MPDKTPRITHYAEYLQLDDLLRLQSPLSDSPDELQFITIHQIHELWFKLTIDYLERILLAIDTDHLTEAVGLVRRVSLIFENLRLTAEHLQTLPPASFLIFRSMLAPASGMQSFQFREIELMAGRRDPDFIKWVKNTFPRPNDWARIEHRLAAPSLAERLDELIARNHLPDLATLYSEPGRCPELYALADALSEFEHKVLLWRQAHIQIVERTIGAGTIGTGGTTHDFLQRAAQSRFFPALWEARNELTRRESLGG